MEFPLEIYTPYGGRLSVSAPYPLGVLPLYKGDLSVRVAAAQPPSSPLEETASLLSSLGEVKRGGPRTPVSSHPLPKGHPCTREEGGQQREFEKFRNFPSPQEKKGFWNFCKKLPLLTSLRGTTIVFL